MTNRPDGATDPRRQVVGELLRSRKYRHVCDATLHRVAEWALARSESPTKAVKRAKRKLHQVYGAFLDELEIGILDRRVEATKEADQDQLRVACAGVLERHHSTAERMDLVLHENLYPTLLRLTSEPRSVLDIACGLHPFALPWMGFPRSTPYIALDIDKRIVELINRFFVNIGQNGRAECGDALISPPAEPFDLVFLLKTIPSLEQQEKGGARRLLESLNARSVIASFPAKSLGGHAGLSSDHHKRMMSAILDELKWSAEYVQFDTELFCVLRHLPPAPTLP